MPHARPVLLCLDTATDRIHAALSVGAGAGDAVHDVVHALDLPGGALASSSLLPALAGLLQQAGLGWGDVDAIAFGSGPGAFTGLRTSCSVTQGLALGLGCAVIALDTLMAVAEDARLAAPSAFAQGDTLWVLQDARMDELYVGAFEWTGQDWRVSEPAQLWPLAEPARRWATGGVAAMPVSIRWAGNAARAYPSHFEQLMAAQAPAVPSRDVSAAPTGQALASLAHLAWARGDTLDAALALPRYVRDKVAQTTAERAVAQAAKEQAAKGLAASMAQQAAPPPIRA
jgi:tRNA threonylcarbamoyladenosine biosynthesis protein TsaB